MISTSVLDEVDELVDDPASGAVLEDTEDPEQAEFDQPTVVAPVVVPPSPRQAEAESEPISPQRKHVLEHLMSMADQYARGGSLRQAIELYFTLVIEHGDTDQAVQACDRLLAVAQQYENHGELRMARGLYERLLKAS